MQARDVGRAIKSVCASEAKRTRGIVRGNVDEVHEDGRASVIFPNGSILKCRVTRRLPLAKGVSVALTQDGNRFEIFEVSAFGGGLGAPEES